jgi:hypothetical protein
MSSTYIDGFTVNTTTQDMCNWQNKNDTNMTTAFTTEHDKFYQLLFFTAHMIFINLLVNKLYFSFIINLNDINLLAPEFDI